MEPILCGIETEYGLLVEGRGAEDQIDDSMALIRSYPDERFLGWDYRFESPRADLRGFTLKHLTVDPNDAKFDEGKVRGSDQEVRSDRVLPNGARLYNDHGHPEFATPEAWSAAEAAEFDQAGELAVLRAGKALEQSSERRVTLYKNNTDFHGASYGTHESYLVPRALGWEALFEAVLPILIARQILTGAGKVGFETGKSCDFQISQRADFFVEPLNAETLFRRPIFNTRDEAHADPAQWMRLHVISGDANMMPACTRRKMALVKLAIWLAMADAVPEFRIKHPVEAFQSISRDMNCRFEIELADRRTTTAYDILRTYITSAERLIESDDPHIQSDLAEARQCLALLDGLQSDWRSIRRTTDWAAKRHMLEQYMGEAGTNWSDPALKSFDLEYHNVDRQDGLYHALCEMNEVEDERLSEAEMESFLAQNDSNSRSMIRSLAIRKFRDRLIGVSWRALTFSLDDGPVSVELPPNWRGTIHDIDVPDVESFIKRIRGLA